jgi:hypothetical protein
VFVYCTWVCWQDASESKAAYRICLLLGLGIDRDVTTATTANDRPLWILRISVHFDRNGHAKAPQYIHGHILQAVGNAIGPKADGVVLEICIDVRQLEPGRLRALGRLLCNELHWRQIGCWAPDRGQLCKSIAKGNVDDYLHFIGPAPEDYVVVSWQ